MRKNLYLAAIWALLCLVSCQHTSPEPDFSGLQNISYAVHQSPGTMSGEVEVRVFPNPFFREVNIMVHNPAAKDVAIFISDEKGKYTRKFELPDANKNYLRVDFNDMPKGVYICEVQQAGKVDRYRLIKTQ
ncbi:T9SS type A sorting domain-containing protein [Pontibacter sp. JH31]|uniref:T9SS type A sorting domain-containing protein n=1 Tax=Pontibacter aquaedesilientis TaxID=2766980 RepID=A0ABR7XK70_9BACT|nr:T9SS type A sorting domain-containing protein [Pontibacter aquaedesilientis]MBD1398023.1 T9SS type A sorting domain-containing protein [Pontibacter aquaedesilientis]